MLRAEVQGVQELLLRGGLVDRGDVHEAAGGRLHGDGALARIDRLRKPGSIVSSNTSGLPIAQIAAKASKDFREHFIGTDTAVSYLDGNSLGRPLKRTAVPSVASGFMR